MNRWITIKRLGFVLGIVGFFCNAFATGKVIFGNSEQVILYPGKIQLEVKFDTGAENASLDATEIEEFEKDGKKWVRFKVPLRKDNTVKLVPLELPLLKYTTIKARSNEQKKLKVQTFKRPVVEMTACVGDQKKTIEVNLTNRSHFDYSMIFGRETIIQFNGVVDPEIRDTVKPSCANDDRS